MSHVIIGTAGHIDHGKTTLIKALTGIDTDRLKEEKARGITIDLGFAHMKLPSGTTLGIVDVPGHEKFVRHMVAGAGGMDLVLLVIAADEGIMPQTREHLDILRLLKVSRGITVLTKADMVEEDWLKLVTLEVEDFLRGTFLQDSPILPVSSVTGEGVPQLLKAIEEMALAAMSKNLKAPFRLPVDRIFTLKGYGTVVTGTVLSGNAETGEEVEVYPRQIRTRIKSIEVHKALVPKAEAEQRAALNLADLKVKDIARGDVIAPVGLLLSVTGLYVQCRLLSTSPYPLKTRQRVRFHVGTKEALGRIYLIDKESFNPAEEGFFYIALEEPVACAYGDQFIIRSFSPVTTLGGGMVLYPNPRKLKRAHRTNGLEVLKKAYTLGAAEGIMGLLSTFGPRVMDLNEICRYLGKSREEVKEIIENLVIQRRVKRLKVGHNEAFLDKSHYRDITKNAREILSEYHKNRPLKEGLGKEELRNRLCLEPKIFDALMELWSADEVLEVTAEIVKLKDFKIALTDAERELYRQILGIYQSAFATPPEVKEVISKISPSRPTQVTTVIGILSREGKLVEIGEELYISTEVVEKAKDLLRSHFSEQAILTVAQFRDLLNTTRKYALPLLEYLDRQKITIRFQDARKAGSGLF